jgi:hypothetical protein
MKKNGKYGICSSNYLESDVFTRGVRRATINVVSEEASRATGKFVGGILNGGSIRSSSRKEVCHEKGYNCSRFGVCPGDWPLCSKRKCPDGPWHDGLGACNPPYAHRALLADLDVGLLLPCNVIVYEAGGGKTHVSAINPVSALGVIESEELRKIAEEVSEKLKRVIEEVAKKKSV